MNIELYPRVRINEYYEDSNQIFAFLQRRAALSKLTDSSTIEIDENRLRIMRPEENLVFYRVTGSSKLEILGRDAHGNIRILSPLTQGEKAAGKENTTAVLSKDILLFEHLYKDIYGGKYIEEMKGIMIRVTKKVLTNHFSPDKVVTPSGNDIFVNNNKFCGIDSNFNNFGIREYTMQNLFYDKSLFEKYLTERDKHNIDINIKARGITGIQNECPEITADQYIREFVEAFKEDYDRIHAEETERATIVHE